MKIKKIPVIVLSAFLGLLIVALLYVNFSNENDPNDVDPVTGGEINYGPPTLQEIEEAEKHKEDIASFSIKDNSPTNANVKPVIVSYGQNKESFEVSARVPGILEDSGNCTLKLTSSNHEASGKNKAVPNVTEMSCGFISIPLSKISKGTWTAVVTYMSKNSVGSSNLVDVQVE